MSERVRAVVFDLDGTLVDSMPLVLRAYAHALAPYFPSITDAELLSRMGGPPDRIFQQLLGDIGKVADALKRLNAYGTEGWKHVVAFNGMKEMLGALRVNDIRLGVWTGRERESAEVILREHGLWNQFAVCVCGDDLPTHKPDPAGLKETLRQMNVDPPDAIFVGDADVDLLAGFALGVRTLLITHGRSISDELRGKAWCVSTTPEEAYSILQDRLIR
jgi:pyrophosphatase PpaX